MRACLSMIFAFVVFSYFQIQNITQDAPSLDKIKLGDSTEKLIKAFGAPKSKKKSSQGLVLEFEMFNQDDLTVTVVNNKVVSKSVKYKYPKSIEEFKFIKDKFYLIKYDENKDHLEENFLALHNNKRLFITVNLKGEVTHSSWHLNQYNPSQGKVARLFSLYRNFKNDMTR